MDEREIRAMLSARHVSPAIIDRVIRLNPSPVEGERLRGIHYKRSSDLRIWHDYQTKGWVIRKLGREAFSAIPKDRLRKQGRRVYVSRQVFMEARRAASID